MYLVAAIIIGAVLAVAASTGVVTAYQSSVSHASSNELHNYGSR